MKLMPELKTPIIIGVYTPKEGVRHALRVALWKTNQLELYLKEVRLL